MSVRRLISDMLNVCFIWLGQRTEGDNGWLIIRLTNS